MTPSIMLVLIWKKITILLYFSDLGHREDYRHWYFSNRHGPACNDNIYILSIAYIFWWKWLEVSWCLCWIHVARYWTVRDAEYSLWAEDRLILRGTQVPDVSSQSTVGHSWAPQPQWWHLGEHIQGRAKTILCSRMVGNTWERALRYKRERTSRQEWWSMHWREIPLQSMEKTMGENVAILQHIDDHVGADIHTAAMADTMPEQMDVL